MMAVMVLVLCGAGRQLSAQSPRVKSLPASTTVLPTIQSMAAADHSQSRTVTQLRRFRDESGNVVAVRELLVVDTKAAAGPAHMLTFLGVEGELPGSPVSQKWQQTYFRFASLFYQQSSFRVRDSSKALGNYTLHDFGSSVRAGRSARRMVVFPNSVDKSIWLLDVDTATSVVLYAAEFDSSMSVLSEVEALVFSPAASLAVGATVATRVPSFAAAVGQLGTPGGLVDPVIVAAAEYSLDRIEIRVDPWNGQQKLVMTYSDGIDQFMVGQKPGAMDPFAGLPASGPDGSGHTIARYRDPSMSVLIFWDAGVAFEVAGSGALQRLDDVAKRLYVQALSQ